jgi:hypothetical protein
MKKRQVVKTNLGEAGQDVDALVLFICVGGERELALLEHAQVFVMQTSAQHRQPNKEDAHRYRKKKE